ncbi:hypothetical protein [Sphingomonas sp. PP-CE-1G-424]|uniref:hypothetical protein n=1 Tax=Sphingomonas sp. PP-CE-1G-424 TaxID=2135658 RepID=UPI001055D325|nr:hypothetical protein [Sphingomonas sp. PP-CE-1G-424]TCP64810.1 hypothetical protein C8J43_11619 [Sphingomonas sp. PP-CE-1G-424]
MAALLKARVAAFLRTLADRLSLEPVARVSHSTIPDFIALPGAARLDWTAFDQGEVRMRYSAVDPVWNDVDEVDELVGLREHVRRLSRAMAELSFRQAAAWNDVAYNLKLAYSVTDVFADTDMDGTSAYCRPAAEYEAADDEFTEKHLAATIIFSFAWTAYERAIEAVEPARAGRGAKGRDLASANTRHLPYLRRTLLDAAALAGDGTDFGRREMRRMLALGSLPGVAAEHLRQFRNRLTHGDLRKPEPKDWGDESRWIVDEDPHLLQFHVNIRLVLLLIQLLAFDVAGTAPPPVDFDPDDPERNEEDLGLLHCRNDIDDEDDQFGFDFELPVAPADAERRPGA